MLDLATSLWDQKNELVRSANILSRMYEAVNSPNDLNFGQWLQLFADNLGTELAFDLSPVKKDIDNWAKDSILAYLNSFEVRSGNRATLQRLFELLSQKDKAMKVLHEVSNPFSYVHLNHKGPTCVASQHSLRFIFIKPYLPVPEDC